MKGSKSYIWVGILLVALGVVFLLQNFGILGSFENLVWMVLFGAAGLTFLAVLATDIYQRWWAVIPGFTLLALGGLIAYGDRLGAAGGALFLGAIGLSFLVIFLVRRDFWWAIIPAGTLLTLAVIAALSEGLGDGELIPGILFLGLAATFFVVYALPSPEGRRKWALIPAGILAVLGVITSLAFGTWINYIWPAALILGGGYLVIRALAKRS